VRFRYLDEEVGKPAPAQVTKTAEND
jgi:hypothetical protein